MTPTAAAATIVSGLALGLALLPAAAAGAGTLRSSPGTFGSYPKTSTLAPPRPPAPPSPPLYRPPNPPKADTGAFKPWKPSMRTDSTRGGVDAYPRAKKPKGYISPY